MVNEVTLPTRHDASLGKRAITHRTCYGFHFRRFMSCLKVIDRLHILLPCVTTASDCSRNQRTPFSSDLLDSLMLTYWHMQAMPSLVLGGLSRLPTTLRKQFLVLQPEDFDLQWTATLNHLLLIVISKTPKREIATRAGTYYKAISAGPRMY